MLFTLSDQNISGISSEVHMDLYMIASDGTLHRDIPYITSTPGMSVT